MSSCRMHRLSASTSHASYCTTCLSPGHGEFIVFGLGARPGKVIDQRELLYLAFVFAYQQIVMAFSHPTTDGGTACLGLYVVASAGGERMIALPGMSQPHAVGPIPAKKHQVMADSRNVIRTVGGVAAPIVALRKKISAGSILPGFFAQFAASAVIAAGTCCNRT